MINDGKDYLLSLLKEEDLSCIEPKIDDAEANYISKIISNFHSKK